MKRVIILMIVFFSIGLIGCRDVPDDRVVVDVEVIDLDDAYEVDTFSLDMIALMVTYDDGFFETIPLEASMLDSEALELLQSLGDHSIIIRVGSVETSIEVSLVTETMFKQLIIYQMGVDEGIITEETYEEWLESIRGEDGRGIEFIELDADGSLIIHYTDGLTDYIEGFLTVHTVVFHDAALNIIKTVTVFDGMGVSGPVLQKEGHVFIGWDKPLDAIEESIDVYPLFAIKTVTISFDSMGGTVVSPIIQDAFSELEALTTPKRSQYHFNGWCFDKTCDVKFDLTHMPSDDITLYAEWIPRLNIDDVMTLFEASNITKLEAIYEGDELQSASQYKRDGDLHYFAMDDATHEAQFFALHGDQWVGYAWCDIGACFNTGDVSLDTVTSYHAMSQFVSLPNNLSNHHFILEDGTYHLKPLFMHLAEAALDMPLASFSIDIEDTRVKIQYHHKHSDAYYEVIFESIGTTTLMVDMANECAYVYAGWDYYIDNGRVTILRYDGVIEDVKMPPKFDGAPVTVIGEEAFKDSVIRHIVIPDSVEVIEASAFAYTQLETITFSENSDLKSIEHGAFMATEFLESFSTPNQVEYIGVAAFALSSITSITMPEGLVTIDEQAFFHAYNLESITIPSTVGIIGDSAFGFMAVEPQDPFPMPSLRYVHFAPSSVLTTIESNAFKNALIENIVLPESVNTLGDEVFASLKDLRFLYLPKSIETMGASQFINSPNVLVYTGAFEAHDGWNEDWNITNNAVAWDIPLTLNGLMHRFESQDNIAFSLEPSDSGLIHIFYFKTESKRTHYRYVLEDRVFYHFLDWYEYRYEADMWMRYVKNIEEECFYQETSSSSDVETLDNQFMIHAFMMEDASLDMFTLTNRTFVLEDVYLTQATNQLASQLPEYEDLIVEYFAFTLGYDGEPTITLTWDVSTYYGYFTITMTYDMINQVTLSDVVEPICDPPIVLKSTLAQAHVAHMPINVVKNNSIKKM